MIPVITEMGGGVRVVPSPTVGRLVDSSDLAFYLFFVFVGPHPWHMEVPRLGVESELQLLVYIHHTSQQCWILNPLSRLGLNPHPHGS